MITVSTISDAEAQAATYALEDGLPPEMPYRVYVHGNLFSEKPPGGQLVSRLSRPADEAQVRP